MSNSDSRRDSAEADPRQGDLLDLLDLMEGADAGEHDYQHVRQPARA